jgi:hypothetical protein
MRGTTQLQCWVTEHDAQLISVARKAATAEGFPLINAIYQVRRDGSGWLVQIGIAPEYKGIGDPNVVTDGGCVVKLTADGNAYEIISHGRWVKLTTRPAVGS